jgi:hypothetical protein
MTLYCNQNHLKHDLKAAKGNFQFFVSAWIVRGKGFPP